MTTQKNSTEPAIVLGAGVNGLGVLRSLADSNIAIYMIDNHERAPEMSTRYGSKCVAPSMEGDQLVDWLVEWSQQHFTRQRPMLFLTQEESVRTISEARDVLAPQYKFTLPKPRIITELMHKDGFYRRARAAGSPVPLTFHLQQSQDAQRITSMHFPAAIKPGRRDHAYSARFKKAYRVETADEAISLFSEIFPVLPDLILQEWIEGEDSDIYFCLQYIGADGETAASFTGRKIRSWPPRVGGTASCIPAPEAHAELNRLTTDFFRATGFVGMGSMEFKRDRNSGRFLMIEPTVGRTDYQEEVAALNGTNIPLAAYCHEHGLPIPNCSSSPRVLWRNTEIDRWSAKTQGRSDHAGDIKYDRTIDAYWRASDPAPWLTLQKRRLFNRIKRRVMSPLTAEKKKLEPK